MYRQFWAGFTATLLIAVSAFAYSADSDRHKQEMQQQIEQQKQQFRKYRDEQKQRFADYRDEQQKALADAIERNWKQFRIYKAGHSQLKNKPRKQPVFSQPDKPAKPTPQSKPVPLPKAKPLPTPPASLPAPATSLLDFYGQLLSIPKVINPLRVSGTGREAITNYLRQQPEYEQRIERFSRETIKQLNLDDWSTWLLVKKIAQALYPKNKQAQRLAIWKWMNILQFDLRIAETSDGFRLLLPVDQRLYGYSFIRIEGKKYYLDTPAHSTIKTYPQEFGKLADIKRISPSQLTWPEDPAQQKIRRLNYRYQGTDHTLELKYDLRALALMRDYPQMDFASYFAQSISPSLAQSIREQLSPLLAGKSKSEQAAIMLNLVQTSFAYQTDDEQFGQENYLFVEETIGYPYADCEDRSILFAWMIHNILEIPYIALLYPQHLSLAIKVNGRGDGIRYKGTSYLVADPTYTGAPVGKTMHPNTVPKVVYASTKI